MELMDIFADVVLGLVSGIAGYLCGRDSRWAFLILTAASVGGYVWYQMAAIK